MAVTVTGNGTEEQHSCWHCHLRGWMGADSPRARGSGSNHPIRWRQGREAACKVRLWASVGMVHSLQINCTEKRT